MCIYFFVAFKLSLNTVYHSFSVQRGNIVEYIYIYNLKNKCKLKISDYIVEILK